MQRKDFLKMCGLMGLMPLSMNTAHGINTLTTKHSSSQPFSGKVIIVGAGAGGLSAGHLLKQQGIDFEILEASSTVGGRLKIDNKFANFPIPLGAEWLETDDDVFSDIINNDAINANIETIEDTFNRKFINYSWYNFYADYILPSIADKISYGEVVKRIDYSSDTIIVSTASKAYQADKVIICVPLKMLQNQSIAFDPPLPNKKRQAIQKVRIDDGFKAFFEFSTPFYGNVHEFTIQPKDSGEKIYYNATFGQNTSQHILGLFTLGKPAETFNGLSSEQIKALVLNELDDLYHHQATPNYIKHTFQNWQNEPYIKGGYLADNANWQEVATIGKPINNQLYFVGSEYSDGKDWVSVHLAAESAKRNVDEILA